MFSGTSKARGERSWLRSRHWLSRGLSAVAVASIAAGALVFDALTPEMISVGILYVALVLLGFWFPEPKATLALAVLATLLAIVGHWITIPDNTPEWQGWLNRALAVGTIWLAAAFVWRIRFLENELQLKIELIDSLSREINHRVGNHLQLVASILRLQAAENCSEESRRVLELAASRVATIGSINRKLYIAEPQQSIDSKSFVTALVKDVHAALADPERIQITVSAQCAELSSAKAAALGALLVELLNNALKHAFADGMKGRLAVSFTVLENQHVLELEDDGVGFDQGKDSDGFGRRSVSNLARAMGGSLTCQPARQSKTRPGTRWRVEIPA
ncbi:sensor histidine kinase [Bradyrhizobium sp.]|uniref:sensor histidine kinase n=1 Tax=Bradyrhizobium sp. TaxID=376 RepID=UPI00239AD1FC|nr:sensor histidine kinase [Bradyrhizobium sp.]MDE2377907.1 sensor histidine kinase [Bradyrhizobium sp.]